MGWRRGQAYGQDLRERVLSASGSIAEVARRFEVSESYVARARARRRRLGDDKPGAQRNHVAPKLAALEPVLAAEVERGNDQTLAQLCAWTQREHGMRVGLTTMWKTLRRMGLTLKKSASTPASRSAAT